MGNTVGIIQARAGKSGERVASGSEELMRLKTSCVRQAACAGSVMDWDPRRNPGLFLIEPLVAAVREGMME